MVMTYDRKINTTNDTFFAPTIRSETKMYAVIEKIKKLKKIITINNNIGKKRKCNFKISLVVIIM